MGDLLNNLALYYLIDMLCLTNEVGRKLATPQVTCWSHCYQRKRIIRRFATLLGRAVSWSKSVCSRSTSFSSTVERIQFIYFSSLDFLRLIQYSWTKKTVGLSGSLFFTFLLFTVSWPYNISARFCSIHYLDALLERKWKEREILYLRLLQVVESACVL